MLGGIAKREHVVGLLVVALVLSIGWRMGIIGGDGDASDDLSSRGMPPRASTTTTTADDGGTTSTTEQTLASRDYEPGDCVMWEVGPGRAETDVVDCSEPHRTQITERAAAPPGDAYPAEADWDALLVSVCEPAAERFLGVPLDPRGRFGTYAIRPIPESWATGEREVWCGIGTGGREDTDEEIFREDVRGADQTRHYTPGDCVSAPPHAETVMVVPCTGPHFQEMVGEVDLSGWAAPPTDADLGPVWDDCLGQVRAYLGADPVAPWTHVIDSMDPRSWAAGTRKIDCFLGQVDPQGQLVVVNTPVRA